MDFESLASLVCNVFYLCSCIESSVGCERGWRRVAVVIVLDAR